MAESPRQAVPEYASSVFVNCPFDADYTPLFRALIFTIELCGFHARCGLELDDAGTTRAEKLLDLIRGCRLGIHDISRTESNREHLPRFNMPYEFGLFVGFKHAGGRVQQTKSVLVLDREPYRYQRFLSDIAGQDIKSHGNDPERLIATVRDWLQSQTARPIPGRVFTVRQFRRCKDETPALLAAVQKTEADLDNYPDYYDLVVEWIATNVRG
jgi:hypothetical protein